MRSKQKMIMFLVKYTIRIKMFCGKPGLPVNFFITSYIQFMYIKPFIDDTDDGSSVHLYICILFGEMKSTSSEISFVNETPPFSPYQTVLTFHRNHLGVGLQYTFSNGIYLLYVRIKMYQ